MRNIDSDLIRGNINTIILKSLYEGDKYGYDIIKEIENKTSGQYSLKQPTLYSCLKRLETQGFISSYWGEKANGARRKYYTLTEKGSELFLKGQSDWEYSRTVMDKLISEKYVDLDSMKLDDLTREQNPETSMIATPSQLYKTIDVHSSDEPNEDNTGDFDQILNFEGPSSDPPSIDVTEEITLTVSSDSNAEETIAEIRTKSPPEYLDSTKILNELYQEQLRSYGNQSYIQKIITDRFTPKPNIHPRETTYFGESYFNDTFEEILDDTAMTENSTDNETHSEVYTSNTVSDQIINNLDSVKSNNLYSKKLDESSISLPTEIDDTFLKKEESQLEMKDSPKFESYAAPPSVNQVQEAQTSQYKRLLTQMMDKARHDDSDLEISGVKTTPLPEESSLQNTNSSTLIENPPIQEEADVTDTIVNTAKLKTRKFQTITSSVQDLGNDLKIRNHSTDVGKKYNNMFYYFSNKLMLTHYGILFGLILFEVICAFLFVKVGLKVKQPLDLLYYLGGVLIAVAFPIAAFFINLRNPEKTKRINFNFKNSFVIRFFIMLQCFIIIYALNIYGGMPLSFSNEYLNSLIVPALLAVNLPLSAVIFNGLYKSKKFAL